MAEWNVAQRRLLSEVVSKQIRDAIGAGRLKPGERLVETDIAAGLGVSKTPVREALRQLEAEGLVVIVPGKGSFVREMSVHAIREIAILRATLESLALRLAMAQGPDAGWVGELEEAVERMRRVRDPRELDDVHAELHALLSARSGSERLDGMLEALRVQVRTFLSFVGLLFDDPEAMAREHEVIIETLKAGDAGAIQGVVDRHILGDAEKLAEIWSRMGVGDNSAAE